MSRRREIQGTRPPTKELLCQNCDCKLEPNFGIDFQRQDTETGFTTVSVYSGEVYGYGYNNSGLFCTLTCGYRYGIRSARAGVKFEGPDPGRTRRRKKAKQKAPAPEAATVRAEEE